MSTVETGRLSPGWLAHYRDHDEGRTTCPCLVGDEGRAAHALLGHIAYLEGDLEAAAILCGGAIELGGEQRTRIAALEAQVATGRGAES